MKIGEAIATLRKNKGLKQFELAEKMGVSVNTICQIEIGNTFPNKTTIFKICEALEVPNSYLLFFAIEPTDVPESKRETFIYLYDSIKKHLLS